MFQNRKHWQDRGVKTKTNFAKSQKRWSRQQEAELECGQMANWDNDSDSGSDFEPTLLTCGTKEREQVGRGTSKLGGALT